MTNRMIVAISALPAVEARLVLALSSSSTGVASLPHQRRAAGFKRSRNKIEKGFQAAFSRVLSFAEAETLRKAHRYYHQNRPILAQDSTDDPMHPDANKIAFDVDQFRQDLIRMIQTEIPIAVSTAANDTLDALGYSDPWKVPSQDTLDLISQRLNLLSGVPDEIFKEVQAAISEGLLKGESVAQLSERISALFAQIDATRGALIASTETAAAYGFASQAAADQAGVEFKQWIHSGLPKEPREDHLEIDGLIVPADQPYPVGDPPLMFPHDPDGSAEDVINCGCISIPATKDDYLAQ